MPLSWNMSIATPRGFSIDSPPSNSTLSNDGPAFSSSLPPTFLAMASVMMRAGAPGVDDEVERPLAVQLHSDQDVLGVGEPVRDFVSHRRFGRRVFLVVGPGGREDQAQ